MHSSGKKAERFIEWLEDESGIEAIQEFKKLEKNEINYSCWNECIKFLASNRNEPTNEFLYENHIQDLAKLTNLSETETKIFTIAVFYKYDSRVEELIDAIGRFSKAPIDDTLNRITKISRNEICAALSSNSNLCKIGLLESCSHFGIHRLPGIADHVENILKLENLTIENIVNELFCSPRSIETDWEDFNYIGKDRVLIEKILKSALDDKSSGVNILIYGTPGTGKTEFCKLLARRLNAHLSVVGETDEDNLEPNRQERLTDLYLAYRLLPSTSRPLVLFDEMEDLFPSELQSLFGTQKSSSKVFLNRMLETNPIPTLWTANNILDRDPAFLRRMTFSIEFKKPPIHARKRIWKRATNRYGLEIPQQKINTLAQNADVSPSIITNAVKQGAKFKASNDELDRMITALTRLTGKKINLNENLDFPTFNFSLLNTNIDLKKIISKLKQSNLPRSISFCLSGLPGTGKSEFARYFADELNMPILQKRASDILGKYVGESEANIASAFEEAAENEAVLIFDEADSLLQSRELAKHQWEVSQVNEMLTWMEKHPFPFFCTTNLASRLDIASLRRFTFKAEFRPLTPEQNHIAYSNFFSAPPPNELDRLDDLTPADFVNVKRRLQFYDDTSAETIISELKTEISFKPHTSKPIGFSVN